MFTKGWSRNTILLTSMKGHARPLYLAFAAFTRIQSFSEGRVCGEYELRNLSVPGSCGPESTNPDGECFRTYRLYLPRRLCAVPHSTIDDEGRDVGGGSGTDGYGSLMRSEPSSAVDGRGESREVLPLVLALHCFGCQGSQMMHFSEVAEAYSFVLAIPEGIQNSWNAKHCCGYSLRNNIDDLGFLRQMIQALSDELPSVRADVAYAMGWSNGGYLATLAASMFRAVAPISGHIYDEIEDVVNPTSPVSLFMHHSVTDPVVLFGGCCQNSSMPKCCCGISDASQTCISAEGVFQRWSELNNCDETVLTIGFRNDDMGVMCRTAAKTASCRANVTLCVYEKGGHFNRPSFHDAFPLSMEIGDFFARDACEGVPPSGTWSQELKTCSRGRSSSSAKEGESTDTYYLHHIDSKGSISFRSSETNAVHPTTWNGFSAVWLVGFGPIVVATLLLVKRAITKKIRYCGWSPVSVNDDIWSDRIEIELRNK